MHYATKTGAALAAALLLVLPATGRAQVDGTLSVEAHGGVGIPLGTFADVNDLGPTFGGTLAWHFHPNWAIRGGVDYISLGEEATSDGVLTGPPVDLLYFGGGVEVNFGAPKYQDVPFTFMMNVGAGMMQYSAEEAFYGGQRHPASDLDQSYLAFNGGARVGYQVSPLINLFVQAQAYLILIDEADSQPYVDWVQDQGLSGLDTFETLWVLPVSGGIRLTF